MINRYEKIIRGYELGVEGCMDFPNVLEKKHINEITDMSGFIKDKDGVHRSFREQDDVIVYLDLTTNCLHIHNLSNNPVSEFFVKIQYTKEERN